MFQATDREFEKNSSRSAIEAALKLYIFSSTHLLDAATPADIGFTPFSDPADRYAISQVQLVCQAA